MGTGVHLFDWLKDGQGFPPQLGCEVTLRDLVSVPLLTEHLPFGAIHFPQLDQLVT